MGKVGKVGKRGVEGILWEGKLQPIKLRKISRNGNRNVNQGRRSPLGLNKIPQLLLHPCGLPCERIMQYYYYGLRSTIQTQCNDTKEYWTRSSMFEIPSLSHV